MALQLIDNTAPADALPVGAAKINANFAEHAAAISAVTALARLAGTYTYATLPDAGGFANGTPAYVSDAPGPGLFVVVAGAWVPIPIGVTMLFAPETYGAVGNNVANDYTAVAAAAAAAKAVGGCLYLSKSYRVGTALDLTGVLYIDGPGRIVSTLTTGNAVTIGTISNANFDMDGAEIALRVLQATSSSSGITATGILIKGMARARSLRLQAFSFAVGIDIAPDGAVGTQYVAFCNFHSPYTYDCPTGLRFNPINGAFAAFANQNHFYGGNFYGASVIAVDVGGNQSNGNTFYAPSMEGSAVSVRFQPGAINNHFLNCRLETAGAVLYGASGSTGDQNITGNLVHAQYGDATVGRITVTHNCSRPNIGIFGPDLSPKWLPELSVGFEDFITSGSSVIATKMKTRTWNAALATSNDNVMTGAGVTFSGRTVSFTGTQLCYKLFAVSKGDILRVTAKFTGTPNLTLIAYDASFVALATLSSGDTPYFGTDLTSAASATPVLANFLNINNAGFSNPFMISINRTEVIWLAVIINLNAPFSNLLVERQALVGSMDIVNPPALYGGRVIAGPGGFLTATYSAGNTSTAPVPNCTNGLVQQWTQNGDVTWGAPTNTSLLTPGQILTLLVTKDASGTARTTAWNAIYRDAPSIASTSTSGAKASFVFMWDGTSWQFTGGSTAFA